MVAVSDVADLCIKKISTGLSGLFDLDQTLSLPGGHAAPGGLMEQDRDTAFLPRSQPISQDVLRERYFLPGESSVDALFDRVALGLASVEPQAARARWWRIFRDQLQQGGIGAGRIMRAAGSGLPSTLINCFVLPLGDCLAGHDDEGRPGLEQALHEAAETLRAGGGVG